MLALEQLRCIVGLFAVQISELGGAVVLGSLKEAERHRREFGEDSTALEALVNHFHLEEELAGIRMDRSTRRREALRLGESLVSVLAERLAARFLNRSFVFLLGGKDSVVLRLLTERPGSPPWFPYEDPRSRKRERLKAFRAINGTLQPL